MTLRNIVSLYMVRALYVCALLAAIYGFLMSSHIANYFIEERSICLYIWAEKIDESILQQFEQETGIKVYVKYYESNEELLTKLMIAPQADCDVMLPTGYIIPALIQANLLKPIDKSKCNFIDRLYPEMMNHYYDPRNEYSLPLYWDIQGFGYDKTYFPNGIDASWRTVFNKDYVPCKEILMVDDSRESVCTSMIYFGWTQKTSLTDAEVEQIKNLFITQKQWVGAYTDFQQGYYLQSKAYPLAVSQREYIVREMMDNPNIGFVLPKEGTFLTIDTMVICKASKKDDLVYEFLNFLYRHDVSLENVKICGNLSAIKDVLDDTPQEIIGMQDIKPGEKLFKICKNFENILTQEQMNDLWISFKAS